MHQLFAAIALVISTILPFGCSSPSNFANRAEEITTVNNFPYSVFVEAPAMQAFEIVTVSRVGQRNESFDGNHLFRL